MICAFFGGGGFISISMGFLFFLNWPICLSVVPANWDDVMLKGAKKNKCGVLYVREKIRTGAQTGSKLTADR